MIIAIDGPAGAGKSTVARKIAQRLGFLYIDTGAMYRSLTLKALEEKIDIKDEASLVKMANSSRIDLMSAPDGSLKICLDSRDVTGQIRQPRITKLVSDIAKIKGVRKVLLKLQRKLGRLGNSVLDGRDIGTVVFPDADRKFYLDAKFQERVRRRYKELKESGHKIYFKEVDADLHNRDTIDSNRKFAPLKMADDAFYIDTTNMTVNEVADTVLKHILRKTKSVKRKTKTFPYNDQIAGGIPFLTGRGK